MRPAAAAAAAADGMARGARAPCTLGTDRPAEGEAVTGEQQCPRSGEGVRGPAHPHAKDTPAVSPRPQLAGASVLHTGHAGLGRLHAPNSTKAPAPQMQNPARQPRPCVHAGARHHADDTPGRTQQAVTRWAPGPPQGRSGVPARLMPLCLPGHLNPPTKDTALQPLCEHGLARGVLEGTRDCGVSERSARPCPTAALCRLLGNPEARAQEGGPPPCLRPSARVEAGLPERCAGTLGRWGPGSVYTCSLRDGKGGRETSSCIRGG